MAKGDSGATSHFIKEEDAKCLHNIKQTRGPVITLPDASTLQATKSGILPTSSLLTDKGKRATIVPGLKTSSLIALPQLCDDGCKVILDKKYLYAIKDNKLVMKGYRNQYDKLWDIPLPYDYPREKNIPSTQ